MRGKRKKLPLDVQRRGRKKKHPVWWLWSSVGFTRRSNTSLRPLNQQIREWSSASINFTTAEVVRVLSAASSRRLSLSLCDQPSALLHSFRQPGSTKTECGLVSLKWRSVSARGARDTGSTSAQQHRNLNAPLSQRCVQVPAHSVQRALRCPYRASHNVVAETHK